MQEVNKEAFILRAVPGSGKTTVAKLIAGDDGAICESDTYFYDEAGNYNFDPSKLSDNHERCFNDFKFFCELGRDTVVVSNTNVRKRDVEKYKACAESFGYRVHVLTVENWHGGKDIHDVPFETLNDMEKTLRNTIKLRG
jgi:hypothetical protein